MKRLLEFINEALLFEEEEGKENLKKRKVRKKNQLPKCKKKYLNY